MRSSSAAARAFTVSSRETVGIDQDRVVLVVDRLERPAEPGLPRHRAYQLDLRPSQVDGARQDVEVGHTCRADREAGDASPVSTS